jgi:hypothetical protein
MSADPNAQTIDPSDDLRPKVGDTACNNMPTSIGTYQVLELLGASGMGRAYLAESELPKRKVASLAKPRFDVAYWWRRGGEHWR